MLLLKKRIIGLFSLFILFFTSALFATDNTWNVNVTPYLWAMNMNGRVQVADKKTHIDESFGDLLHHMNMGGMIWIDAGKGKLQFFGNIMYAALSNSGHDGPLSVDAQNKFGIFSAGISYELYKWYCGLALEPYAGARYTLNDTTLTVKLDALRLKESDNQHWTDPLVGARLRYSLTQAWQVIVAGDIGGTNTKNDYSYNAIALLGYHPQTQLTRTTIYVGYRVLYQRYTTGSGIHLFNWDMKLFGPLAGLAISF
ncbi:MAG: hypothetical protein ACD_45C00345G0001 [uncultured bacterium]|nr:MAG: hypothetical protein ACD_45C00345G0001 [uncultured bacterium]